MNYTYPTSNSKNVEELNNFIFYSLMNLGFPIAYKGTIHFKNIVIIGYLNDNKDYSFTDSLNVYSQSNSINIKTIKSSIFRATTDIKKDKFNNNFYKLFNYEPDLEFMTPYNLYECFMSLLQLKSKKIL